MNTNITYQIYSIIILNLYHITFLYINIFESQRRNLVYKKMSSDNMITSHVCILRMIASYISYHISIL